MTDQNAERRKRGAREMHFQTVVQTVVLGVLIWVGNSLVELRDNAAKQTEKILAVEEKIGDLKQQLATLNARFDNYPTRNEVESRFQVEDSKHTEFGRRLESLEGRRPIR